MPFCIQYCCFLTALKTPQEQRRQVRGAFSPGPTRWYGGTLLEHSWCELLVCQRGQFAVDPLIFVLWFPVLLKQLSRFSMDVSLKVF